MLLTRRTELVPFVAGASFSCSLRTSSPIRRNSSGSLADVAGRLDSFRTDRSWVAADDDEVVSGLAVTASGLATTASGLAGVGSPLLSPRGLECDAVRVLVKREPCGWLGVIDGVVGCGTSSSMKGFTASGIRLSPWTGLPSCESHVALTCPTGLCSR